MNENKDDRYIALYCRVSTQRQGKEGYNIREQEYKLENWLDLYNHKFIGKRKVFVESGRSGSTINRPELNNLLQDIKKNKVKIVAVHSLDRLTRSMKDFLTLLDIFKKYDVQFISMSESFDTTTPVGKLMLSVLVLFAQWELETIKERTMRSKDQSAREGKYTIPHVPFGYDKHDKILEVNKQEALIVKEIFKKYLELESVRSLVYYLNDKYQDEYNFNYKRVHRMLTNTIYMGKFSNDRIEVIDFCEPIIEAQQFEKVSTKLDNKNRKRKLTHLFKGKVFCVKCQEYCISDSSKKKSGTQYKYLFCSTCKKRLNEDKLSKLVGPIITKQMEYYSLNDQLVTLYKKLKAIDIEKEVCKAIYLDGGITELTYKTEISKLIENEKSLTREIQAYTKASYWELMTLNQKRLILRTNVERIDVDFSKNKVDRILFK